MSRDEPKPPACPDHGRSRHKACDPCNDFARWYQRQVVWLKATGKWEPMRDAEPVRKHLIGLTENGEINLHRVAALTGVSYRTIRDIAGGRRKHVLPEVAAAICGLDLPDNDKLRWVDATGTRRRMEALARAQHGKPAVAKALDVSLGSVNHWFRVGNRVPGWFAAGVRDYYNTNVQTPGTSRQAGWLARYARQMGDPRWLPWQAWTPDTIDDPLYDPFAEDPDAYRPRRRLRALAYAGWGETELADITGEDPKWLRRWTRQGRAWSRDRRDAAIPRYVLPLIDPLYRSHAREVGPNQEAADHARACGWRSWYSWQENNADIDDVDSAARRFLVPRAPHECNRHIVLAAYGDNIPAVELTAAERTALAKLTARRRDNADLEQLATAS